MNKIVGQAFMRFKDEGLMLVRKELRAEIQHFQTGAKLPNVRPLNENIASSSLECELSFGAQVLNRDKVIADH